MAYITKSAIKSSFDECIKMLDNFDKTQIKTLHAFIAVANSTSRIYDIDEKPVASSLISYFTQLRVNEDGINEMTIFNRFRDIKISMTSIGLLKLYQEQEKENS